VLDRMKKKYLLTAGSPPLCSMVIVGGPFPPMHVYRFSVLHYIKRRLQSPLYLESASWKFKEEKCPLTGEQVFSGLHTSDWWKNANQSLAQDLVEQQSTDSKPPGLHFVCPLILFDDSILCDNIGRLKAQPVLLTVGNISDTYGVRWRHGLYWEWYHHILNHQRKENLTIRQNLPLNGTCNFITVVSVQSLLR
jgi:hypothetical protein